MLTKKQIGKRISELRKLKGLSQQDLAKMIKISRPSLTQIELGNRDIGIIELQKLSKALGFTIDVLIADKFDITQKSMIKNNDKAIKHQKRNPIPVFHAEKFKAVMVYILEQCAGKSNFDENILFYLLYFCDFNYYELYEEHLTGSTYKKISNRPISQEFNFIIKQMLDNKEILRIKTHLKNNIQTRYLPLIKTNLSILKANEIEVINEVIEYLSDWSIDKLKRYTQQDMPIEITDEGKVINYELALYRELPYSVRTYTENN